MHNLRISFITAYYSMLKVNNKQLFFNVFGFEKSPVIYKLFYTFLTFPNNSHSRNTKIC